MSDMTYRTVTLTARVYSGSDDHAKWIAFWSLMESEYGDVLTVSTEIEKNGGVS